MLLQLITQSVIRKSELRVPNSNPTKLSLTLFHKVHPKPFANPVMSRCRFLILQLNLPVCSSTNVDLVHVLNGSIPIS
jgi:hypothetical protein